MTPFRNRHRSIIAASLLCVVAVGLFAGRKQDKTAKGYFLASGRLPWFVIGTAFVSTSVSSEQIVGTVGMAYKNGMGVANWEWWTLPVYCAVHHLLRAAVPEDADHHGPRILCSPVRAAVLRHLQLDHAPGLCLRVHGARAVRRQPRLLPTDRLELLSRPLAHGRVVAGYTAKGGLASVMWTDALQCIMLLGGGITLYFIALANTPGGWSAMVSGQSRPVPPLPSARRPDRPVSGHRAGNLRALHFLLGGQPGDGAARAGRALDLGRTDGRHLRRLHQLLPPAGHLLPRADRLPLDTRNAHASPAGITRHRKSDTTFPFALKTLAPEWGLRGIILAGFLAAVMSATSALSNSVATIFSFDVYKKLINRNAPDRRLIFIGRLAAVGALCIAACVAPSVEWVGGIFKYFQTGVSYLATPFISILWMGILWRRTNYPGSTVRPDRRNRDSSPRRSGGLPAEDELQSTALALPGIHRPSDHHDRHRGRVAMHAGDASRENGAADVDAVGVDPV